MTMPTSSSTATSAMAEQPRTLVERIAGAFVQTRAASAVFGEPVERGDTTVIPVAKARWGFGGGAGRSPRASDSDTGYGGGGGMMASPIGYIVIRSGTAEFRPIPNPLQFLLPFAAGALAGLLLARRRT